MTFSLKSAVFAAAALSVAAPAIAQEVNIYSYRQPELIAPLTDAFTAETGIKVNVAYLSKGMIERLQSEGDRSPADVVLTVDISRLAAIVNAGLTQPVSSDTLKANVPAQYRDPDANWYGLTTRARIVYASRDRVADGEVTTYEDLADPKWQGRICTRSGTHAYNVALTSAMIEHLGEDGARDWLEGIKSNLARKPQGNDRAQVKAIWAGQCDISLGNTYYMGLMLQDPEQTEWADSVRIVFPEFENGGTHVNVSGIALTQSSRNTEEAIQLMEYMVSPDAQAIYAESNHEYPVLSDAELSETVASWGTFTPDDVDLSELASHRATALRIMEEVDFDG